MSDKRPFLVLLGEAADTQLTEQLQREHRVISLLRPRLMVVDIDDDAASELRQHSQIAGVFDREVPADVVAQLPATERLFVSAWSQQQTMAHKQRRGDGLSWDAAPFEPPDAPHSTKNH
jgi:hypothetical protein